MRYYYNLAILTLFVIVQGSLLPVLVPWLPLAPAFLFLIILSFHLERRYLLIAAVWTGLVQDILLGEMLGLFMLTNFLAMAVAWELKEGLLDNKVLTGGLRVIAATLIQEVLITFIYYTRGLESENLALIMQVNAGINLLSNLLLYILFLALVRLRGVRIATVLEARK